MTAEVDTLARFAREVRDGGDPRRRGARHGRLEPRPRGVRADLRPRLRPSGADGARQHPSRRRARPGAPARSRAEPVRGVEQVGHHHRDALLLPLLLGAADRRAASGAGTSWRSPIPARRSRSWRASAASARCSTRPRRSAGATAPSPLSAWCRRRCSASTSAACSRGRGGMAEACGGAGAPTTPACASAPRWASCALAGRDKVTFVTSPLPWSRSPTGSSSSSPRARARPSSRAASAGGSCRSRASRWDRPRPTATTASSPPCCSRGTTSARPSSSAWPPWSGPAIRWPASGSPTATTSAPRCSAGRWRPPRPARCWGSTPSTSRTCSSPRSWRATMMKAAESGTLPPGGSGSDPRRRRGRARRRR